ncbi:lysylphosphatidylglycerol synthase transmembrane domain-containing protein [Desulfococcaceae bacterium HSG8]|nr:lysylphosphatidylglycerol synthase transmembrane domain-containing protein [Desulfococcaceae bacterium HSG8]
MKKMLISLLAGITISAVGLYLAFRNVPFSDLILYLGSVNYFWIIPAVLASLASFIFRALRWQVILDSARETSRSWPGIPLWYGFHVLMIGFMLNCVLPGRLGEVARPAILQKRDNVPFSTGLATVAGERVADLLVLITLFAIVFSTVQIDPDLTIAFGEYQLNRETLEMIGGGMIKLMVIMLAGIIMVSFSATRQVINGGIMGIPSLFFFAGYDFKQSIREKICTVLVGFVENVASGFALVRSPKKTMLCMGLSVIIWGIQAFSYYIVSLGCPGIELSYPHIIAVMLIICFFIALPSVPGYWGIWEAGGVFALGLFGISAKDGAGFTLINHAVQVFPVIIAGLVSAMIIGVNIWQISYEKGV